MGRTPYTASAVSVLAAIDILIRRLGWPPSTREICTEAGLKSTSTVQWHMDSLESAGLIVTGGRGSPRALRITTSGLAALEVLKLTPAEKQA